MITGIDPGWARAGWAVLYETGELAAAGVYSFEAHGSDDLWGRAEDLVDEAHKQTCQAYLKKTGRPLVPWDTAWAVERMQADGRTRGALAASTLDVQLLSGAVAMDTGAALYSPRDWKGSRPKSVEHGYLRRVLRGLGCPLPDGLGHDGWDAIGIAAHHHRTLWPAGPWSRRST